jgi:hypothetical protein
VTAGSRAALAGLLLLGASSAGAGSPPAEAVAAQEPDEAAAPGAKIWLGREAEIEELLRTAEVVRLDEIAVGVLKPRCAWVEPGLPFARMCWKAVRPQKRLGFVESYKAEVAAYELDKLLGLGMVPPTVERKVRGEVGSAMLWVENVHDWDMKAPPRGPDPVAWARELVRCKMFDQLIGNVDRNQGNLLYDDRYNLILIDHSRAFTDVVDLRGFQKFQFVDMRLWAGMKALDRETLKPALGKWVSTGMLLALLQRRDRMARAIDELAKTRGVDIWLR